jgi:hypothetical protein
MKNLNQIIRNHLRIISEGDNGPQENYMFFSNLEQIKRQCDALLKMDPQVLDSIIQDGHDWADDHVSEAKTNMDQIFDFFMNKTKEMEKNVGNVKADLSNFSLNEGKKKELEEGKNKPNNPKLWAQAKSKAKSKFKVYPSAYANGWAAKWYKEHGGGWRKTKK